MAPVDKEYLEAKFDGLEKLMRSEKENTISYINAVSKNTTRLSERLDAHEKDSDAHGAAVFSRGKGEWISLAAVGLSAAGFLLSIWMRK